MNYIKCCKEIESWCDSNYLILNPKKTKELVFDFRKGNNIKESIKIKNEIITPSNTTKYLGVIIDDKLNFYYHLENVIKKATRRMHHIRLTNMAGINKDIKNMLFQAYIVSVLTYACPTFFFSLNKFLMNKVRKIFRWAKNMAINSHSYKAHCMKRVKSFIDSVNKKDELYFHNFFKLLPHGRLNVIYTRTDRFRNSLIPSYILYKNKLR